LSAVTHTHGMQEGKGERYLASGRQYGNALLGVRHQEEEVTHTSSDRTPCIEQLR